MITLKETLKNLKKVYGYGKEYKKNLIIFSLMSLSFIIINIIVPIVSAKQLVYITDNKCLLDICEPVAAERMGS